ncbi:MAG: nitrile hydratase subunit beta [Alphaproteobacteria bacterium]|nr:nitrile hydratase subunit beta [Alphaproteobacteria bacterium]
MTRIHDMGGRYGDGPVTPDTTQEPVFEQTWHGRALALTLAAGALGRWNIDASRHVRECLPPADYARFGYYEKWLGGLANILVAQDIVSADEIAAGRAHGPADDSLRGRRLAAEKVVPVLRSGGPSARPVDTVPRFAIGAQVTTRPIAANQAISGGHTRLPAYAAGKTGTVVLHHGGHVLPDSNAHFDGEAPEHLYTVSFAAGDLWQHAESPADEVCLDLWDSYLTPA